MKKALILGRFMPFHKMHRALFDVVQDMGYELMIGLLTNPADPINARVRREWLAPFGVVIDYTYKNTPYDLDGALLPRVDLVAGSNPELIKTARALGVPHFLWDPAREANPMDADEILHDPATHWYDMPVSVRLPLQKRVTFVGPESVGKSWFAKKMAERFGGPHVPEYGRPHEKYREAGDYSGDELAELAHRHGASRHALSKLAGPVLFEDTDELMTAVWSEMLLEKETEAVEAQIEKPSLYILYHWDTPWEEDRLRYFARADLRRAFYDRIERKLKKHGADYVSIGGSWDEREAETLRVIEDLRSKISF